LWISALCRFSRLRRSEVETKSLSTQKRKQALTANQDLQKGKHPKEGKGKRSKTETAYPKGEMILGRFLEREFALLMHCIGFQIALGFKD
jgi:hypothetical protein